MHLFAYQTGMPAYRFYNPARPDDAPVHEQIFFNDSAALRWAFKTAGPGGVEVWESQRFVGRLHGGTATVAAGD